MASRAPTLSKPKTKPKVTTKPTLAKAKPTPTKTTALAKNALTKNALTKTKSPSNKSPSQPKASEPTYSAPAATPKSATKTLTKNAALKPNTDPVGATTPRLKPHAAHSLAQPKLVKPEVTKTPSASGLTSGKQAPAQLGAASLEAAEAVQPKPRRRAKEVRTRIYWAVFNTDLRRVAVFEFDQRDEAQRRATKLAETSGEHHFIQKIKAIVQ